jgi:5-methylthioadenosine/S-adenosylhomocysteine deaminase
MPAPRRWTVRLAASLAVSAVLFSFTLARAAEERPRTLIKGAALIVTMDPSVGAGPLGTVTEADILLAGDTIAAVGKGLSPVGATVIETAGKIVLPGFVDIHNHLYQSAFRGGCTDEDVLGWLAHCNIPVRKAMTEADIYAPVRLSTLDLIGTGVTTVVDWVHLFKPEVARAYVRALSDSGLRFMFAYTQRKDNLPSIKQLKAELIDPNPLAGFQLSGGTLRHSEEHLALMVQLARELKVTLNVHLLENAKQRQDEPMKLLEKTGALALGRHLLVNHAVHLTDDEIALLAKHDVRVSHNPLSNMRLASGIIRLPELHAAGIKVGLGLDGGTNDTSDMFSNMRAAVGLQRAKTLSPTVYPTVVDVLRMATLGSAEALDMGDKIGSLTPGKKADLIILDPGTVNFAPQWDWLSQIVFNAQPANVEYVFVNGRMLKEKGRFVGVKPDEVIRAADEAAQRLRRAVGAR